MSSDGPDPADVVARLEAAAERLRAQDTRTAPGEIEVRDLRPAPPAEPAAQPSEAQLRMRAARRRLAALEAELGWDIRVHRGS